MKKIVLAAITIVIMMSLISCNNSGTVNNKKINNSGTINNENLNNNKITIEEAKEIALKHANLKNDQVKFISEKSNIENGVEVYDIEFYHENEKYNYEINSSNGEIIEYDYDAEYNNLSQQQTTTGITLEEAKEIALKHANLTNDQVIFGKSEIDNDGIQKYDIEFYKDNVEYNYEIDANTGEIISYEQDK